MKKSYLKILLFELIIFTILILNIFESSILSLYKLPIFILILDVIFYFMLGYERDNRRNKYEVLYEIFMGTVIFILIYYLFGIIIGFAKTTNYYSMYGLAVFILPLLLTIIFKEHLRGVILTKCGDNKFLIILTTIMFILFDLTQSFGLVFNKETVEVFKYFALIVLPSISTNIFLTYMTKNVSYKPSILYLLVINLYQYLLPIVPNPSEYLKSIIDFVVPVVFLVRMTKTAKKFEIEDIEITRSNNRRRFSGVFVLTCFVTFVVYFISGYFRYYAIAIVSGSMEQVFSRGDIVVVEQIKDKYDNKNILEKGEIIAFKQNNTIVVHRIIRIVEVNDTKFYYTKGDANNFEDNWAIPENKIIGVVRRRVPLIGYPTVWFSEL